MPADVDIPRSYRTAVEAAETGTAALRLVWPAAIPSLAPAQDSALRDGLRHLEDGWAALLRVQNEFDTG